MGKYRIIVGVFTPTGLGKPTKTITIADNSKTTHRIDELAFRLRDAIDDLNDDLIANTIGDIAVKNPQVSHKLLYKKAMKKCRDKIFKVN